MNSTPQANSDTLAAAILATQILLEKSNNSINVSSAQ